MKWVRTGVCVWGLAAAQLAWAQAFGVIGDAGFWNASVRDVARSMRSHGISRVILAGDNLYDEADGYAPTWDPWFNEGFDFPLVALGNHYSTYQEEMQFFGMPAEYYSRRHGVALFIVLNSDNVTTADAQARFLEREIRRARKGHVFVVFHHPPFTLSDRHTWKEKEAFQLKIREVLLQYSHRITAVIVGHDHIATLVQVNDLPLIVSGGVFEQFTGKHVNFREGPFQVKTRWMYNKKPHWVKLDYDHDEAWANYIRADNGKTACSVRLSPKPILLKDNCAP